MLVKCKCHAIKIERDTAYRVTVNNKNEYYCSENEYKKIIEARNDKNNVYDIINKIFGYKITNTILFKEMAEISNVHTYKKVNSYLLDNQQFLEGVLSKPFNSEYAKIRYFSAILKNNLKDYKPKHEEITRKTNSEIVEVLYTPKDKRKSISDLLQEME